MARLPAPAPPNAEAVALLRAGNAAFAAGSLDALTFPLFLTDPSEGLLYSHCHGYPEGQVRECDRRGRPIA